MAFVFGSSFIFTEVLEYNENYFDIHYRSHRPIRAPHSEMQ